MQTAHGQLAEGLATLDEGLAAAERALMRAHCLTRVYATIVRNRLAAADLLAADQALALGADTFYDAGDKGCGSGPLNEIADLMLRLTSGQTLEIRATDPSVAVDLTAWCRLTGHTLVTQEGDRYLIRHK